MGSTLCHLFSCCWNSDSEFNDRNYHNNSRTKNSDNKYHKINHSNVPIVNTPTKTSYNNATQYIYNSQYNINGRPESQFTYTAVPTISEVIRHILNKVN
jgi:hypothetical protein